MTTWLVIDGNNLAWRSYHTTGHLYKKDGTATGIAFGFLRALRDLQRRYATEHVIFAWDSKPYLRKMIYPAYKWRKPDPLIDATRAEVYGQVDRLRKEILPLLGCRNQLARPGYEADDVMASVCRSLQPTGDKAILVSNDQDLYQLLGPRVAVHNPTTHELITANVLRQRYGTFSAAFWISVKALAGCVSDNIKGVPGVGEKTAIKYIKRQLNVTHKVFGDIMAEHERCALNRRLVTLPWPGIGSFRLVADDVTRQKWDQVLALLDIESFDGPI